MGDTGDGWHNEIELRSANRCRFSFISTWPLPRPTSQSHRLLDFFPNNLPLRSSSFARRKAFAIKHQEAEPLTRRDLQHDFLHHVFASQERVFTDPTLSSTTGNDPPTTVTFRDLYVHALMNSPRCSRALRDKMVETPDFATDFAKISLLANVGRVNTTMTCPFLLISWFLC